jgi:hypothetical protein
LAILALWLADRLSALLIPVFQYHGHLSRKKRLPTAGETITLMFVPSSLETMPTETQLVVLRSVFCCKRKVWAVAGHDWPSDATTSQAK